MGIHTEEIFETINTPFFFSVKLVFCEGGLKSVDFIEKTGTSLKKHQYSEITSQFLQYFDGKPVIFSHKFVLPQLNFFAEKVLLECFKIPYGSTITYKRLAELCGTSGAFRAVGGALRKNPLPIIIPCHRVIGSDGSLKGFMGKDGLEIKRCLLKIENAI